MQSISFNEARARGQATEKIRLSLQNAIDSRGRHYKSVYALSFHFARDQTGGNKDSATFASMARSLGVEAPQVFTIPDAGNESRAGPGPEYAVGQKLWSFLISCAPPKNSEARVLVLLHYAGHGMIDKNEELVFFADSAYPRTFRFNYTLNPLFATFPLFAPSEEITLDKIDAVTILDACQVGIATRSCAQTGRAAEVVSAVRANQTAFSNQNQITFTSRLASEVTLRRGMAHASMSFPEVIVEFQRTANPKRFPEFKLLTLTTPVRVHLLPPSSVLAPQPKKHMKEQSSSSQSSSSKMASSDPEELRIVFTLHLPHDPEENDVRRVTEWIDSLDSKVGLELSGVYRANSTILILECHKSTWYSLEGKEGFKYVAEVYGNNLRKQGQGTLRELPTNRPSQAQRSSMGSGPGGRAEPSPH
ncbi:hypothetical protein MMC31_004570, partial [Peltigera leucophlebia]|nr:hypothetical protein [Peltigera leucophlebia]